MPGQRIRTEHMLPFNRLSGEEFERLCLWVLALEGYEELDLLAGSGDGGVDLTATQDGRRIYVQCKNVATFGKAATQSAFEKILEKWPREKWPDEILLAVTASSFGQPARAAAEAVLEGTGIHCSFWPLQVFDLKVSRHPEILEKFFGTFPEGPGTPERLFLAPRRNPYFRGRESVLEDLRQRLTSGDPVALSQTIRGLGGVGKTQTAIEYCHRHADDYRYVLWFEAATEETLAASASEIAQRLRLAAADANPEEVAVALAGWFGEADSYLLVYDNLEAPEGLRSSLPLRNQGHVLVTTRKASLPGLPPPLSLDVLDPDEALELIEGRLGRSLEGDERFAAAELATELGYLPLALEQASAFLANRRSSIGDYLSAYQKRRLELLERVPPSEGDYELTVATTWELNFAQVTAASEAAVAVLKVSAFLEPQGIPLSFFTRGAPHLGPSLAAQAQELNEPIEADELLVALLDYSLIDLESERPKTFRVHRLVQEVTLQLLSEAERETWKDRAIKAMAAVFPADAQRAENWAEVRPLFPHAVKLHAASGKTLSTVEATSVGAGVAAFAFSQGSYAQAREAYENVVSSSGALLGVDHTDTLTAKSNLAVTLFSQGNFSGARELQEEGVATNGAILGEGHPYTLTAKLNLAQTLFFQGDLSKARALQEEVVKAREALLGEHDPDTLIAKNNLALTLKDQGDLSGAQALQEEVVKSMEALLGEHHPETLTAKGNLAGTLFSQGDLSRARALEEEVVKSMETLFGESHPHTLTAKNNLAQTLKDQGDLSGARALQEEVVETSEALLGEYHPGTLRAKNNLALTLKAQGDLSGARTLQEAVVASMETLLGENHPNTLLAKNNLALTLKTQGDLSEARTLQEAVVTSRKAILGENHPYTLIARGKLAAIKDALAKLEGTEV